MFIQTSVACVFFLSAKQSKVGSSHTARWRYCALPFQTHIRSPIGIGCTNIPLACGKDPGRRDHSLQPALKAMSTTGSSPLDCRKMISRPAIVFSFFVASSGSLHDRPLDRDPGGHIFPQGNQ